MSADLASIIATAERASTSFARAPADVETQLRDLVTASRQTLGRARRMIRGYQQVSLRGELETAVTLLRAAGIDARLVLPAERLPDIADDDVRSTLQTMTGRLLLDGITGQCVIMVSHRDGRVHLEIGSEVGTA